VIFIIIITIIIITITSEFISSLVLVTVFPQRGTEQGEHVCAIMFNKLVVIFQRPIILTHWCHPTEFIQNFHLRITVARPCLCYFFNEYDQCRDLQVNDYQY
jgi:hypothetical protein